MMEKSMKFFALSLFFAQALFAENFTLENKTNHKIALEWASSARMVQESNESLLQGEVKGPSKIYYPNHSKTTIAIPKNSSYFRVLVWQGKESTPHLLTNWIEVVPGKTYILKEEHLTPVVLMNGMGC